MTVASLLLLLRPAVDKSDRIAKVMARRGAGSRRQIEQWILEGKVRHAGEVVTHPALVIPYDAPLTLAGKPVPLIQPTRLWMFHKPIGVVTSRVGQAEQRTVFEYLPGAMQSLKTIGRLDINSEGLLLLTNDGELANQLAHPDSVISRHYHVRVHGSIPSHMLQACRAGLTIDGMHLRPIHCQVLRSQGYNHWVSFELTEGKNREIRRICQHFELEVDRLIRVQYGPYRLGELPKGSYQEVQPPSVRG